MFDCYIFNSKLTDW